MALITKQLLVCNKCSAEVESASTNLTIMGEDFYLCDNCLERLLNWVNLPPVSETGKPSNTAPSHVTRKERTATNLKWDSYTLDKLVELVSARTPYAKCAVYLGTSVCSITSILHRIRTATVGSDLYSYKRRLDAGKHGFEPSEEKGDDE